MAVITVYLFHCPAFFLEFLLIGNGGGSVIAPIPDLIGIGLFFSGVVTYEFGERSINACIPPGPVSSIVVFLIVYFIARRFKSVAYYKHPSGSANTG